MENTQGDKTSADKSAGKAVANQSVQKKPSTKASQSFEDNRPEVIQQKKLQDITANNPDPNTVHQLKQIGEVETLNSIEVAPIQRKNDTGLPDNLKSGTESLSGQSLDDVKVHYNSDKPAQLQAHAYAQGTDIHVGPGQEQYLSHEAWHVVQQKEGRVKPTVQMHGGVPINDDAGLEKEADLMGAKALSVGLGDSLQKKAFTPAVGEQIVQRAEDAAPAPEPEPEPEKVLTGPELELGGDIVNSGGVAFSVLGCSFEGEISDEEGGKGEGKLTGPDEAFEIAGEFEALEDRSGYKVSAEGSISAIETPEAKAEIPLLRVPLGIPGIYAAVDLSVEASASVGGKIGIEAEVDNDFRNPHKISLTGAAITASAEAKLGIFGGVSAGVPSLAEIKLGAEGSANAKLEAQLGLVASKTGLSVAGELKGEAKGELALIAAGNLGPFTKKKSIPIVSGKLGELKKEVEGVIFTKEGMKSLVQFTASHFTRNKGDEIKAEAEAAENIESEVEGMEEVKKEKKGRWWKFGR